MLHHRALLPKAFYTIQIIMIATNEMALNVRRREKMDKKWLSGAFAIAFCFATVTPAILARENTPVITVAYSYNVPFHQKFLRGV